MDWFVAADGTREDLRDGTAFEGRKAVKWGIGPNHVVLTAGPWTRCVITRADVPDEDEQARR